MAIGTTARVCSIHGASRRMTSSSPLPSSLELAIPDMYSQLTLTGHCHSTPCSPSAVKKRANKRHPKWQSRVSIFFFSFLLILAIKNGGGACGVDGKGKTEGAL